MVFCNVFGGIGGEIGVIVGEYVFFVCFDYMK